MSDGITDGRGEPGTCWLCYGFRKHAPSWSRAWSKPTYEWPVCIACNGSGFNPREDVYKVMNELRTIFK